VPTIAEALPGEAALPFFALRPLALLVRGGDRPALHYVLFAVPVHLECRLLTGT